MSCKRQRKPRVERAVDRLLDCLEELTALGLDPWPYGAFDDNPAYGELGIALDDGTVIAWNPVGTWDRAADDWLVAQP